MLGGYKPFPGNQIPNQYWDSVGQQILALFPAPNGSITNNTTNYHYLASTINNWDQESGRFDYTISAQGQHLRPVQQPATDPDRY